MDLTADLASLMAKQQQQFPANNNRQNNYKAAADCPGYVTEKLYMLLQLYLQNKGWNSSELLQCFAELKDSSPVLPNAAYLQVMANRLALDSQGRLVLRDNGKIVLPFEHFANAVMLKHMSGPHHGLHLNLEATMRAVIESYTIGRENFGMEKEFIIEVVQSCPNPACRYYKSHLNPFEAAQQGNAAGSNSNTNISIDLTAEIAKSSQLLKQQQQQHQQHQANKNQQHLSNVIMQQNRALAQQSLEKFGNLSAIEKQRMLQQLDKKHYESLHNAAVAAAAAMCPPSTSNQTTNLLNNPSPNPLLNLAANNVTITPGLPMSTNNNTLNMGPNPNSRSAIPPNNALLINPVPGGSGIVPPNVTAQQVVAHRQQQTEAHLQQQMLLNLSNQNQHGGGHTSNVVPTNMQPQSNLTLDHQSNHNKINDYIRNTSSIDSAMSSGNTSGTMTPNVESIAANKDLLALHNGAWGINNSNSGPMNSSNIVSVPTTACNSLAEYRDGVFVGQEKIVRAFTELMRNMAKMKTFIRPSMCKPYGKQSESLQKTLMDTIQLVQSLRNCLPAPHIPVSSWKSEDRNRQGGLPNENGNYDTC